MINSPPDANIPTLTEVIVPKPGAGAAVSGATTTAPLAAATTPVESRLPPPRETTLPYVLREEDRKQLEHTLNERVLRQVQERIDFVLEHRVRDSLADALQVSIEGLTAEIKRGLHQTLEDVISRAVAQELARLQNKQK